MKKLVVMITIGALAGLLLLPPTASAVPPKFGLKAGVNLADINGADVGALESFFGSSWKSKVGFCGGGFVIFPLSKGMAIQAEALYTQKGAKMSGTIDVGAGPEPFKLYWNTDYMEIPVLFRYAFGTAGNLKPFLYAGPSLGIKVSAKLKVEAQGISEEENIEAFRSTDFGLVFGGGVDIGKIAVDLRYTLGLTKLLASEGETADIKNGVFSLMVGYSFK